MDGLPETMVNSGEEESKEDIKEGTRTDTFYLVPIEGGNNEGVFVMEKIDSRFSSQDVKIQVRLVD